MSNVKRIPRTPGVNAYELSEFLAKQGRIITSDGSVLFAVERRRPSLRVIANPNFNSSAA